LTTFRIPYCCCSSFVNHVSVVNVDRSGYRRSALSSRNSIHFFRKLLPLLTQKIVSYLEADECCECSSYACCLTSSPCPSLQLQPKTVSGESWQLCADDMISEGSEQSLRRQHRNSPLRRRFSPRKPTSPSVLLRTRLTMTTSFSRP
jgi:hypothetical protein